MKRLNYLDGLKGWCAIFACLIHFLLTFAIDGFIGWRCLPEAASQPAAYYGQWLPYSIFINTSFPLYLFFAIIAFIICHSFFKSGDEEKLKQNILMRYFRFLPLVLIVCLAAWLLLTLGLCPLQEFYDITGNTWIYARLEESFSFFDALKTGFVTALLAGTQLVSPFWCLHYIFFGSLMTCLIMLLYGRLRNKPLFFAFLILLLLFTDQTYLPFVGGIIAAVLIRQEPALKKAAGAGLVLAGAVLGVFPPIFLPNFISITVPYTISTVLILVGTHCCFSTHRLLCNRFIAFWGRESLGAIAWHMLVLQSLNLSLHNALYRTGMDSTLNMAINFVVNAAVSLLLIWVSSQTITPLTNHICNRVRALFWSPAK